MANAIVMGLGNTSKLKKVISMGSSNDKFSITKADLAGVTSIRGGAFSYNEGLESLEVPDSVVDFGKSLMPGSISGYMYNPLYNYCPNLKTVYIGAGVTSVGGSENSIFTGSTYTDSLESITVSSNNPSYYSESGIVYNKAKTIMFTPPYGIKNVTSIPSTITSITSEFYSHKKLQSISIPSTITSISTGVSTGGFCQCTSLATISVNSSNANYSSDTYGLYNKNKTILYYYALGNTTASPSLPSTVTTISAYAFYYAPHINSIIISSSENTGVTSIGQYAFAYSSIISFTILDSKAPTLNTNMLAYCKSLLTVSLSNSGSTSVPNYFCYQDTALTTFSSRTALTTIGTYAFSGCTNLSTLSNVDGYVKTFNNNCFYNCKKLTSAPISAATTLGSSCFSGCTGITGTLTIPSTTLTTIGQNAFHGCTGITAVVIPANVTTINAQAFYGCTSLTSVTINRTSGVVTLSSSNAFTNTGNCPIYVPSSLVSSYKSASQWSSLSSRIYAIS